MVILRFYNSYTFITADIYLDLITTKKVQSFLIDRQMLLFLRHHSIPEIESESIIKHIKILQNHIYSLDTYLSTNWMLSEENIKKRWRKLRKCLTKAGFPILEADFLLEKIQKYMNVKINTRSGVLPTDIKIDDYYTLKICDTELQRNIIRKRTTNQLEKEYYLLWQICDLLSEIIDDIEDLEEDRKDYNCNRLILDAQLNGDGITKDEYLGYVERLHEIFFDNLKLLQNEDTKAEILGLFTGKYTNSIKKLKNSNLSVLKSKILLEINK